MTAIRRTAVIGVLAGLVNAGLWAGAVPRSHAATVSATLVRTTDTSRFIPPSPDPSGITYLPGSGRLLISDGEVEEMSIYAGKNLFEVTRTGTLAATGNTTAYTREPVGLSLNPATNRLYISDDDQMRVFEVRPGSDGRFGTSDDTRTSFSTSVAGDTDPEGVDVDTSTGELYTIDGLGAEVYRYTTGGTMLAHFDVRTFGARDPEGIAYFESRDHLLVLDGSSEAIYEVTKAGTLVNVISITAAHPVKAAGLTTAPASNGSGATNLYIVDRGVDNDVNRLENDGKLYEMTTGLSTVTNKAPVVNAGPDQTVVQPGPAALAGTATDDGLPNPPGTLTRQWSTVSGPAGAAATFTTPTAATTAAGFPAPGAYSLRLTASDSQLSASDDVTVTVLPAGTKTIDVAVAAGADDAEEQSNGSVLLNSGDLELTTDGSAVQTVGLRFASVGVPRGATIQRAYVQFQVDEVSTEAASVLLSAQDADNAPGFASTAANISARPRLLPGVPWVPADWMAVGARGPAQQTPDLSSTLQQIVGRSGWSTGNAIVVIVTGSGRRTAEAVEGSAPPVLHVEYLEGTVPMVNAPPSVNAGPDQSVLLAAGAVLSGVVTDDGLPDPATLTTAWTKVSGPDGALAFADPTAPSTTATFPVPGVYVLRLSASDSVLSSADDVTITVTEAAAPGPGIRRETSATIVNTTATSTVTIAAPVGTAPGDVLVACLALNGSMVAATGVPAGWSPIASVTSVTNPRLYGYYRVAGGSEPASYAWRLAGAVANGAGITRYSGVNPSTPLDGPSRTAAGAAATTGTVPGVTTVTANALLVGCMAINSGNTGVTIASPAGMAESWDVGGKRLELADGPQASPGATGDQVWTFGASREWAGWLAALRPV